MGGMFLLLLYGQNTPHISMRVLLTSPADSVSYFTMPNSKPQTASRTQSQKRYYHRGTRQTIPGTAVIICQLVTKCLVSFRQIQDRSLNRQYTNLDRQVVGTTKSCAVVPNISETSVWKFVSPYGAWNFKLTPRLF